MNREWINVGAVENFAKDLGSCVKVKGLQIAVFNLSDNNRWYAVQNLCPHDKRMVLSRGIVGDKEGDPKVTCPMHKNSFSLTSGQLVNEGDVGNITTYPVKVEDGKVFLEVAI
ncbi:nitrite reductase small subunit NirD [Psychromonas sp.]|uniref:nitrite reductase small subunit NirD n=1 Tax=Psychromonas sp. TaxID=1884585 RepID=UPI00356B4638